MKQLLQKQRLKKSRSLEGVTSIVFMTKLNAPSIRKSKEIYRLKLMSELEPSL